jgi:hemerythrin superfamily protein
MPAEITPAVSVMNDAPRSQAYAESPGAGAGFSRRTPALDFPTGPLYLISGPSTQAKESLMTKTATATRSSSSTADAIALLKADHEKVKGLFAKFKTTKSEPKKKELAMKICQELIIHTKIEEDVFYPALKGNVKDDLWHEAQVEHDGAKVLIAEIRRDHHGDEFYDAKVIVLSEMIKHHVEEEEERGGMFAQARKADVDLKALGKRMANEKKILMARFKENGTPMPETPTFTGTRLA